jgi:ELWxxDGT repeat protein
MVRVAPASLLCLALLVTSAATAAYVPPVYLVRDIGDRVLPPDLAYLVTPPEFAGSGFLGFFFQDDGVHGEELWRSDGTALGTRLVRDICPGACGEDNYFPATNALAAIATGAVFAANDGVHGLEPWWTDGTDAGTRMIADLAPGGQSSDLANFVSSGALVFFQRSGRSGEPLAIWRTDGTAQGTYPVAPAADFSALASNGTELFFGNQGGLWKSDGTIAGTVPVVSGVQLVQSAWPNGSAFRFLPDGRLLFSAAPTGSQDAELWVSDGSAPGTHSVRDSISGSVVTSPGGFYLVGSEIFFRGHCSSLPAMCFWRTDGTDPGTHLIPLPDGFFPDLGFWGAAAINGNKLIVAGISAEAGSELWAADDSGVEMLADIRPGPESGIPSIFASADTRWFASLGDRVVLLADDGVHGSELWSTDGTVAGTFPLPEVVPGPLGIQRPFYATFIQPTILANGALLRFRDEVGTERLLASDGTPQGTRELAVVNSAPSGFYYPALRHYGIAKFACLAASEKRLYFTAGNSESGVELWTSAGDSSSTRMVSDFLPGPPSSFPQSCVSPGDDDLLVTVWDDLLTNGTTYRTDGSAAGTETLFSGFSYFSRDRVNGEILGETWSGSGAPGVFLSDGSVEGTRFLGENLPFSGFPEAIPWEGGLLVGIGALYRSDGTEGNLDHIAGLSSLEDFVLVTSLTKTGDRAVFIGSQDSTGYEVWSTDGTTEGTHVLVDLKPGPDSAIPFPWEADPARLIVPVGPYALFAADDGIHGLELWATDGTAAGTAMVADLYPGAYPSSPKLLTPLGGRVYFVAEHPTLGQEVWVTDGTAAGTHVLADLAPGAASSVPLELSAQAGKLYFSAWTPATGREAWKFDPLGPSLNSPPTLVADLAPGPLSSSPFHFTQVGPRLYFVANDNSRGFELWALPDAAFALLFEDGFDSGNTSRWSATAP